MPSRSPIRGGHDEDGLRNFEFPSSGHDQGDRHDNIPRRGSWGTHEGGPGPTLYPQSFGAHSHGARSQGSFMNPFLDPSDRPDEDSRGHRLRRSTNNFNLRGNLASSRSTARPATRLPRSTTTPNLHARLKSIQESQPSVNVGGSFINPLRPSHSSDLHFSLSQCPEKVLALRDVALTLLR